MQLPEAKELKEKVMLGTWDMEIQQGDTGWMNQRAFIKECSARDTVLL